MGTTDPPPANIVAYRSPETARAATARLGMQLFIAGWVMMFAALLLVCFLLRARLGTWPPPGEPSANRLWPAVNIGIAACSSLSFAAAIRMLRQDRRRVFATFILTTFGLGLVFAALQAHTALDLWSRGLRPSTSPYGSLLYGLSGFHLLHVSVGLVALLVLFSQGVRRKFSAARHNTVTLWRYYWDFVGILWAALFVAMFM